MKKFSWPQLPYLAKTRLLLRPPSIGGFKKPVEGVRVSLGKLRALGRKIEPSRFFAWFVLTILLSSFSGFLAGFLYNHYSLKNFEYFLGALGQPQRLIFPGAESKPEYSSDNERFFSQEEAIVRAVKKASPAVVSIIVSKDLPVIEQYFLEEQLGPFQFKVPRYREKGTEKKEIGGGTGFIVSSLGLILSNKHVVLDQEADYTVLTNEGQRFQARVLARDPFQDIAILKIETAQALPVLKLADSDRLEIGQTVIAIGNVLGEFRNSVSVGVVSGLSRKISASGGGLTETLEDVIQTDAAINKGNSGGPLLNLRGEAIGMNTAMALEAENIGFAIPINKAKKDIRQVQELGKIVYPFLGIYYTIITPELQKEYNLPVDYGAWVGRDSRGRETEQAIFSHSPAERAGLKRNDIILEMAGEKIDLDNPLAKILSRYDPGDSLAIKVQRAGEKIKLTVVLAERSD